MDGMLETPRRGTGTGDRRRLLAAIGAILALGILLRAHELGHRSLWLDEAWRANTLLEAGSVWGGFRIRAQNIPPLFAATSIALTGVIGASELALRAFPCLLGIGALLLVYPLARRFADRWTAVAALALFAFAPTVIYYTRQFEHYAADLLFSVLVIYAGESVFRRERGWRWAGYAGAAVLSVGYSYGALFVTIAVSGILFRHALRDVPSRWTRRCILAHIPILAAFLATYFLVLRAQLQESTSYAGHWAGTFPDTTGLVPLAKWLITSHLHLFQVIFDWGGMAAPAILAMALVAMGLFALARRREWRALAYLALPCCLCLMASFLGEYPYSGRALLFATPMLLFACAAGLTAIARALRASYGPGPAAVLPALMIVPAFLASASSVFPVPRGAEELRPVIAALRQDLREDDAIFVYYKARAAFDYYYRHLHDAGPCETIIYEGEHRGDRPRFVREMDRALARRGRIWFVFSHFFGDEVEFHLKHLEERATRVRSVEATGACAHLFLAGEAEPNAAAPASWREG